MLARCAQRAFFMFVLSVLSVTTWPASDGHCNNQMGANSLQIGVGCYEGDYWTQVFGSPAD